MKTILAFLAALATAVITLSAQTTGYWDGRFWMANASMPRGLGADAEGRLIMLGGDLSMSGIQRRVMMSAWDGMRWTPTITNRAPVEIAVAGGFTWLGGMPSTNAVTRLASQESLVLPFVNGRINALTSDANTIFAAGQFVAGDENSATNVARWNGTAWTPLGGGVPYPIAKLLATNGFVYAGVSETTNWPASVWQWNGSAWTELAPILRGGAVVVRDLEWHHGKLLVATMNTITPSSDSDGAVLSWSGTTWENLSTSPLRGQAYALSVYRGELFVAGDLRATDPDVRKIGIGRFVDGRWVSQELDPGMPLGNGMAFSVVDDQLFALARVPSALPINDGTYTTLWQFDGATWRLHANGLSPVPGFRSMVNTPEGPLLAVAPSSFGANGLLWNGRYFEQFSTTNPAGDFTFSIRGGIVATSKGLFRTAIRMPAAPEGEYLLTRLEGNTWQPAGDATSVNLTVATAMASSEDEIFVAGSDASAGNALAVARWSDGHWGRIGGTFAGGQILSLAFYEKSLLAGGSFKSISGQPITNFARWDGTNWQAVLPAPDGPVRAMALHNGGLFVAGSFTNIGGIASPALAFLRSGTWQSAPAGLGAANASVVAISDRGSVAIGSGSQVWIHNGDSWRHIGTGQNGSAGIVSLLWRGQDLFVGGGFIEIGGVQSDIFAIWHEPEPALSISTVGGNTVRIARTGARNPMQVLGRGDSPAGLQPWRTNSPLDLRDTFIDTIPAGSSQTFYSEIAP